MRRCLPCLLLLLLFFPGPAQGKKKDPDISALFRQARYVYVEAVDGDEFNPRLYPEDRQAIADLTHALQTWNRYALTIRRQDADLVFVVRKGRLAAAKVFAGVRSGSRTSVSQTPDQDPNRDPARYPNSGAEVGASGEVGSPDDFLIVEAVRPRRQAAARESGCNQERTDSIPRRCRSSNKLRTLSTKLTHGKPRHPLLPGERQKPVDP